MKGFSVAICSAAARFPGAADLEGLWDLVASRRSAVREVPRERWPVEPEAMHAMLDHAWPGNVRELEHVVERAVLMAQGSEIQPDDLGLRPRAAGAGRLESMTLDDAERYLIQKALERCEGNVSRAADALGLSRSAMYRRLQHHGIAD